MPLRGTHPQEIEINFAHVLIDVWLHLSYRPTVGLGLGATIFYHGSKDIGRQLLMIISRTDSTTPQSMMKFLWSSAQPLLPPLPTHLVSSYPLNRAIAQTFVIACNESTQQLEFTLRSEGLTPDILRQQPRPDYQHYARSTLALLNHRRAWERATHNEGLTLIVEADFVPVRGIGKLPLPFAFNEGFNDGFNNGFNDGNEKLSVGIAWLYTCAAQIYSVSEMGYGKGFSTAMVAYIITPKSAIALLEIFQTLEQVAKPTCYKAWDSQLDYRLRQRGFENFISFRNYGEHGGRPNPEHKRHGLSATHRADVLYGPLAFTPAYALSGRDEAIAQAKELDRAETIHKRSVLAHLAQHFRYLWVRGHARIKGIGRLIFGRFLHTKVARESSVPLWLLYFAIRRHFSVH